MASRRSCLASPGWLVRHSLTPFEEGSPLTEPVVSRDRIARNRGSPLQSLPAGSGRCPDALIRAFGRGRLSVPVTSPSALPPPADGRSTVPHLRFSRLWWVTGPLLLALIALISVVAVRPAPYIALLPGSARSVAPLIKLSAIGDGPKPHREKASDNLLFVTVSIRRPSGAEALWRTFDDTAEVVPEKIIDGGQSREENRRFNLQLMTDSKDKATKVALERTGYEVKVTSTGAVVVDLNPSYPVAKVLTPGDTIVGADGSVISTTKDLVNVIAKHKPGEDVKLRVQSFRTQEIRPVSVELQRNPDDPAKAQLGVSLENRPKYTFPIKVEIDSGEVGGPSAGLAFTLALIDRLTPGSLTGHARVAVTGTINLDGRVGPVGGVAQKTEVAVSDGAKLFIVPTDEYAAAKKAARGRLRIRQVSDVDQALAILRELGGDPVLVTGKGR